MRAAPCFNILLSALIGAPGAVAGPMPPDITGLLDGIDLGEAYERQIGIVTVPSFVGLVGGADAGRRGALAEGYAGNGMIAIAAGDTSGLAAPAAGVLAPPINPVTRRTANLRADGVADRDLRVSAGMTESREMMFDTPGGSMRERQAAGLGSAFSLFDGRVGINGELAATQLHEIGVAGGAAEAEPGLAQRVGATATVLRVGTTTLGVNGFHQSARAGYAGGIAPDLAADGGGAAFRTGPLTFGLQAERSRNNLDHLPDVLTQHRRALTPSVAVSLDALRGPPAGPGKIEARRLLPSAVRFSQSHAHITGLPEPDGPLGPADATDHYARTDAFALDWSWQAATTTLALAFDSTDSRQPGKELNDDAGHGVTFSHAIRGDDRALTIALTTRRGETEEPGNRRATDSWNVAAAYSHRDGWLGDMVASIALHQDRINAYDARDRDIDTSWQARAAFDLADLPAAGDDGRLMMAVSVRGQDPDAGDESLRSVETILGLTGKLNF